MEVLKHNHMDDYLDIMIEFEEKKRGMAGNKVTIRLLLTLRAICEGDNILTSRLKESKLKESIQFEIDKIRVNKEVIESLFDEPVNNILSHLQKLLSTLACSECTAVVMVGGFSSQTMQNLLF